ncbi:MAG TPA: hypothetical protein VFC51_16415 [Chloroflexota bacterium]|nr:hypothetical protein [Chloroflexota bacterium]
MQDRRTRQSRGPNMSVRALIRLAHRIREWTAGHGHRLMQRHDWAAIVHDVHKSEAVAVAGVTPRAYAFGWDQRPHAKWLVPATAPAPDAREDGPNNSDPGIPCVMRGGRENASGGVGPDQSRAAALKYAAA